MKRLMAGLNAVVLACAIANGATAADRATAEEAASMVKKAVAFFRANGKDKAFAEFSNPNGQFKDRDLYIFAFDMSGKMLAHGANPRMVGKNMIELRDADGKYMIKTFIDLAGSKGKGWTDFKWVNPVTNAIERKSAYVEKADDVVIGSGIYTE